MKTDTDSSRLITKTLELEFGAAPHQQIGLFGAAATIADIPAAQQAFSQLLQDAIVTNSPPGARVALVGTVLSQLATDLAACGVKARLLKNVGEFEAGSLGEFDFVVVAGTYCYLDQLSILSRCREQLRPGAQLLIFGEFLQDDGEIEFSSLAQLSSLRQLAARLGYQINSERDLSEDAHASVQLFNRLLDKHSAQLLGEGSLVKESVMAAKDSFAAMERELGTGRRKFHLLQLQRAATTDESALGEYALADYGDRSSFAAAEIADLFERSFEKSFNPDLWHWKYDGGDGKCVVARIEKQGAIVAHYGGAPRKILYFGKPAVAIQVCDVMVLPEQRSQYGKSSLFFKIAATFLEREIGNTVGHLLGFDFPNQKAMNIATRLGLYEKTDDFIELQFPALALADGVMVAEELDTAREEHREAIDHLWEQMAPAYASGIVGRRDSAYVHYRYFSHPYGRDGLYHRLLLKGSPEGQALACAVLKPHEGGLLLMDLICAPAQMSGVIRGLQHMLATTSPGQPLKMWLTRGWIGTLIGDGVIVKELGIEIPCNSWNPGPAAARLYGKWWLTAGDMDFM